MDNLLSFNQYKKTNDPVFQQACLLVMEMTEIDSLEDDQILTEELIMEEVPEKVKKGLAKVGLKIHKGKGLIDYLKDFSFGLARLIWAAIRGDKKTIKEIANTQVTKEDVLDFLYKLDLATLHVVTGPLHFIDAVTGWDISVNLKQKLGAAKEKVVRTFKDALEFMKQKTSAIFKGKKQKTLSKRIQSIEKTLSPNYLEA